jgi:cytochrome c biogenesis protein CcmG/thiol:disulfide interchange protein DsbE
MEPGNTTRTRTQPSYKWGQTIVRALVVLIIVAGFYFVARHRRGSHAEGRLANRAAGEHGVAPDFALPDLAGKQVNLSSYRGQVVLLDFWATWCGPCREEIPHFVQLQNKYANQGLQIIGVSMDDGPDPVRDFYRLFQMNYPVVMGNAKTGELYGGVLGLPIAFLIGRDGRITARHIGAINFAALEKEIVALLRTNTTASQ